jgi:16S rRNA (guanine966-N2)-methyltransferase
MKRPGTLRVIGGRFRGRRLVAPPGLATRPLPDRIKQSLFDWLGQRLDGLVVVDCCAGSGSFGCEALSRGAATVHVIEPAAHAQPALRANVAALGDPPELVLHRAGFEDVLPRLRDVDLVFADPPFPWYATQPARLEAVLRLGSAALAPGGRLVIRGERGATLPAPPPGLVARERRDYGRSWLALFARA